MTTSEQAAVQVSSSSLMSPQVRIQPSVSRDNPRLRTNSGKQDGRDSTTEAENVDDSQSVSEVANTLTRKPHRWRARRQDRCRNVKTKLVDIRQQVDRNRARWSRLGYEWFTRRTTLLASEERR